MRFLFKITMPVEAGNKAARDAFSVIPRILAEQKPEAIYFVAENGQRTAYMIIHMDDASQIAAISEPWFLALDAAIEVKPAMVPEDLEKAGPAIHHAVSNFGLGGLG
ncbi:MAG: hypothetical protein GY953_17320 [bacterium]|nr:hypothetical protein [bacterium]